jgi:hypothetical protein
MTDHYKLERLIELLLMTASDIVFHLLSRKGEAPSRLLQGGVLESGRDGAAE